MANPRGSKTKVGQDKSRLVAGIPAACSDEQTAVEFMERQRWGDSSACPRCGDLDVYQMRSTTGERNKRFLWRCRGCKQQFTVRVGTIMEDSPIPVRHWCYAFWAACASKKGVSALQIKRMTGVSYKSALFMMHRIRWAMAGGNDGGGKLTGTIEADETYVGGKTRSKTRRAVPWKGYEFRGGPAPDFKDRKTPVVALVERGGEVRAKVLQRVTAQTLGQAVREYMDPSARLMTDELAAYKGIGRRLASEHQTVKHSLGEYVRGEVHTNTVEGFFALLKRGVYGTFHSISKKHLHRYVGEFQFRYNSRDLDDGERMTLAILAADRRRLTYQAQIAG
jgi:transposase-like protein